MCRTGTDGKGRVRGRGQSNLLVETSRGLDGSYNGKRPRNVNDLGDGQCVDGGASDPNEGGK